MRFIYSFFMRCFFLGIWIYHFFNEKASKWLQGRKNQVYPKIDEKREVIWFHCASLGEFDQALPLMNLLKKENPNLFLLLTFFSPSGYEHFHKRSHQVDFACYLPLDTKANAQKFLNHFQPSKAFFVKYEFWANFILEAKKNKVNIYSICTILRPNQRFFKWHGGFFRTVLQQFDYFFVQNKETKELLQKISFQKIEITGDLRFDRVIENKNQLRKDELLETFTQDEKTWILGSSWLADENFLKEAVLEFIQKGKVIIAPHDISEKHLLKIEALFEAKTQRYSNYSKENDKKILIIDSIGKLANAYFYGDFAYVGGGFTGNLHNILEPAVFGLPIIIGPKHKRFPEAQLFIDEKVAFSISNKEELNKTLEYIQINSEEIKVKLLNLVAQNAGASLKIAAKL